jgi:predicted transcriptional regulator
VKKTSKSTMMGSVIMPPPAESLLPLVAKIVSAHVEYNDVRPQDLARLIRDVYQALAGVVAAAESRAGDDREVPPPHRGSTVQTVFNDHLVCMECGLHMKMLKRHLQTVHDSTPAQYRAKWRLPGNYPMVARQYAELRSSLAKGSGLGKRPGPRKE